MLPAGLTMRVRVTYRVAPAIPDEILDALPAEEKRLLDRVRAWCSRDGSGADREKLLTDLGLSRDSDLPERLLKKGVLLRDEERSGGRGRDRADSPVGSV